MAHGILVQAGMDIEELYGVKKCAQIVFKSVRIVKGQRLKIL